MRVILEANKETHIEDMLNQLKILSVEQVVKANTLKMFYKIETRRSPKYLQDMLCLRSEIHQYQTRHGECFNLPNFKTVVTQKSLFYKGTKLYNLFRDKHINLTSFDIFKIKCHEFVKITEQKIP